MEARPRATRLAVATALAIGMLLLSAAPLRADRPQVAFDLPATVVCHDATTDAFAADHPQQRIIEMELPVSTRLVRGRETDIVEVVIEIRSRGRRMRVYDFSPSTTLESPYAEPIEIRTTSEKSRSIGLGLSGHSTLPVPGVKADVAPNANLGTSRRRAETETVKKHPPQQAVIVSGTSDQQYGVFFKLKPSDQGTLEGLRRLVCQFVVPRQWRADYVEVRCHATGEHENYFVKSVQRVGYRRQLVALYMAGDTQAREAADRLARAQLQYAARNRIAQRTSPLERLFGSTAAACCPAGADQNRSGERGTASVKHADPAEALIQAQQVLQELSTGSGPATAAQESAG